MRTTGASRSTDRGRDVLLDTGPLVAVLDARDHWHARCAASWPAVIHRCVTTEAVVCEATHLVGRGRAPAHVPLDFLLAAGIPIVSLPTGAHPRIASLMSQYATIPMDYADATLVALSEALRTNVAFTLDRRGFAAYRSFKGARFTLMP